MPEVLALSGYNGTAARVGLSEHRPELGDNEPADTGADRKGVTSTELVSGDKRRVKVKLQN